jgi:hypothetical protein
MSKNLNSRKLMMIAQVEVSPYENMIELPRNTPHTSSITTYPGSLLSLSYLTRTSDSGGLERSLMHAIVPTRNVTAESTSISVTNLGESRTITVAAKEPTVPGIFLEIRPIPKNDAMRRQRSLVLGFPD